MPKKIYFILLLVVIVFVIVYINFNFSTLPNFEGNISFRISEEFTGQFDGPHLYLSVSTKEIYGCINYGFEHNIITKDSTIKVLLGGISSPDVCLTAVGPADFSSALSLKEGAYALEFHSKYSIDKYLVNISKGNATIEPIVATFSKTEQTIIDRIPENLLWAECFYNAYWIDDPRDDFCERFFTEIETIAQPYLIAEEGKTPRNQFYLYTGEEQPLIYLIRTYNREDFSVSISTWEGKTFACRPTCFPISERVAHIPKLEVRYIHYKDSLADCELEMEKEFSEASGRTFNVTEYMESEYMQCIMEVAFFSKNETLCLMVPVENQNECLGQVGMSKLDESFCEKAGNCPACRRKCYAYIAIKKEEPELCKNISVYDENNLYSLHRYYCYENYALKKNDKSICYQIPDKGWEYACLKNFE